MAVSVRLGCQLGGQPLKEFAGLLQQRFEQICRQFPPGQDRLVEAGEVLLVRGHHLVEPVLGYGPLSVDPGGVDSLPSQADAQADRREQHHGGGGRCQRAVLSDPSPGAGPDRLAASRDRLVGQPVLEIVGQGPGRRVAIPGLSAIAFRQTASSARGMFGLSDRGGRIAPRWRARGLHRASRPPTGGWPVSSVKRIAPRP